jgi:transcriptional regulator with XRE-family HTH domain
MATLKTIRESSFLTQRELAELSGVTAATINRLENDLQKPTFKTIKALAKALKIDPKDLEFH